MSLVDRMLRRVAPRAALRRARDRVLGDILRGYDAAKAAKRGDEWMPVGSSANAEISSAAGRLRARSRDLVRNNAYAARAVDVLVANIVGTGITPRCPDDRVMALWNEWAAQADADGPLDVYGQQALAVRGMIESGDVFQRFRERRAADGLAVPFQVQVLEADFLDSSRVGASSNGNTLLDGIEFDALGRRVGYWIHRRHPGDSALASLTGNESTFVPARQIAHAYRKARPGQVRGAPWLAPSMLSLRDLDDFFEATLVKKKIEACFAAFVTKDSEGVAPPLGRDVKRDDKGARTEVLEPGFIEYLQPGEDVKFAQPTTAGGDEWFVVQALMRSASGCGVTYDQMTGDLRRANYSSLKAGRNEFRQAVEQIQWHVVIPMICAPVWRRFIETAVGAQLLPDRAYPVEWVPPAFQSVDPLKDVSAEIMAVRAGLDTLDQAITRRGNDPREHRRRIAEINAELDALGLVLTTDPRKVNDAGAAQATGSTGEGGQASESED